MQAEFIHNYIFDLDGTLIDSSNQVLFCLEHALVSAGVLFDKSKLTSNVIGPPLVQSIKNADYILKDIKELLCLKLNYRITLQKD